MELLEIIGWDVKFTSTLLKQFCSFIQIKHALNIQSYNSTLRDLSQCNESNIYIYVQGLYMFIADLLIVVNNWNPLKCMS